MPGSTFFAPSLQVFIRSSLQAFSKLSSSSFLNLSSYERRCSALVLLVVGLSPMGLSCTEEPRIDTVLQMWPHLCWKEGKDHLTEPSDNIFPKGAQDPISPLGCKGTLFAHAQHGVHWDLLVFFWQFCFPYVSTQHILMYRGAPP